MKFKEFVNPKLRKLAKANKSTDFRTEIADNEWVGDSHIMAGVQLLKQTFPRLKGLQDTLCSKFKPISGESIQIHNTGNNHWVLSHGLNGKVYIYDSLFNKPKNDLILQLCQCYENFITENQINIKYEEVFLQKGSSDCVFFALAYAHDIAS